MCAWLGSGSGPSQTKRTDFGFYSGLVGGLPFVARVALLACIGVLAFVVCAFGGFLLSLLPANVFLTIASL